MSGSHSGGYHSLISVCMAELTCELMSLWRISLFGSVCMAELTCEWMSLWGISLLGRVCMVELTRE